MPRYFGRVPTRHQKRPSRWGITSGRLYELGLVDQVIPEPLGGAHRDVDAMAENIKQSLIKTLDSLKNRSADELIEARYKRLMSYGQFTER